MEELGGTCSTNGRGGKCVQNFALKTSREETTWEALV